MHLETKSVLREYTGDTVATQEAEAVTCKQEISAEPMMSAEPLQCLDAKDGTFTNAGISDVYKRHGISDSVASSPHAMPWYPFDQLDPLGTLNAEFGMKSDKVVNWICPMIKTEQNSEPQDRRVETGDSGVLWKMEHLTSAAAGSDSTHSDFDMRPLRAVTSVAPTHFTSSAAEFPVDRRGLSSDVNIPASHFPPPLLSVPSSPSAAGRVPPTVPFSGKVLNASRSEEPGILPGSLRDALRASSVGVDDISESEPEPDDGHFSPPPERVNQEAHRSRNAM